MLDSAGTPCRFSLRGKKWKYRGEGNANLVLALPQERKIVRLRKCESEEEREWEHVWREAVFCRGVMVPLLGDAYIQPPVAARMDRAEVKRLDQAVRAQRPLHRHHKSLQFGYVTIYPDYALLPLHLSLSSQPMLCVEVKPKQGWVPVPDRRLSKCTFCLNQYLKLKNRSVQGLSHYCPLDLFSGNRTRMMRALRALVATPQNNLKVFEDGILVYGEDVGALTGSLDKLCHLVLEALTRDLVTSPDNMTAAWERDCQDLMRPSSLPNGCSTRLPVVERVPTGLVAAVMPLLPQPPCDWTAEPLPADCILDRILRVQKLDRTGADRVYEAFRSISQEDYGYMAGMLSASTGAGPGLTVLHRYLLATTAKDCSIMVAFQKLPADSHLIDQIPERHVVRDPDGQAYVMNVGVTDLDPKPLSCIEKHRKRDCEVLRACLDLLSLESK